MSNPEETNQILCEIRDLLLRREEQYKEHLAESLRMYEEQIRHAQKAHWKNASIFAVCVGAIVGAVVMLLS